MSFQPVLCLPHAQTRLVLFLGYRISIPNLELFPNRVLIERSRIAFPITVLPKDDRTDFAPQERLDLPYWTMIFGHLCFGRRIQMSGHSDFGIFNNDGASSILTGCTQILRLLLVMRILVVLI